MRWLRLRPRLPDELEMNDWRGRCRWTSGSDDEGYADNEEEMGPMGDFDPIGQNTFGYEIFC